MTSISTTDFDYIRELVRRESAIVLDNGKEYLAESRLQPLMRQKQLASFEDLVTQLKIDARGDLQRAVVDALTTNETSFFRDAHPWDALRDEIIPDLLERNASRRQLSMWCGAASSGQEPYTLSLLLREHFSAELAGWDVRIVATDISETMLARARDGRYSQLEVNRGLPAPLLLRWFERDGMDWRLRDEIRSMVTFLPLNLSHDSWLLPPVDLILLRNVLIYFDEKTKREILERAHHHLRPDGWMLLGASETTFNLTDLFARRPVGRTTCYRPA